MTRPSLTPEQRLAARTNSARTLITAVPGSGKTRVLAERFGYLRYAPGRDRRRLLALSFTRAAQEELRTRIKTRWARSALDWPHYAGTIDALHAELLHFLLRECEIRWPEGHKTLEIRDSWQGVPRAQLRPGDVGRRVAVLRGREVVSEYRRGGGRVYGLGEKLPFDEKLASGICTHEDVRSVIAGALSDPGLRSSLRCYLAVSTRGLIIDEIYDANDLDLDLVRLAVEADLTVTMAGDPWQAIYEFRGARPVDVQALATELDFARPVLRESHRFKTSELRQQTTDLRDREPVGLPPCEGARCDVVLASTWEQLWLTKRWVLPLCSGPIRSLTDAALVVLLDRAVELQFGVAATRLGDAVLALGLEMETFHEYGAEALGHLFDGAPRTPEEVLEELRVAMIAIGCPYRLRRSPVREALHEHRAHEIVKRSQSPWSRPGLTIHQAKGREWRVVGVRLTPEERTKLQLGLHQSDEDDRVLYVALTRATHGLEAIDGNTPVLDGAAR